MTMNIFSMLPRQVAHDNIITISGIYSNRSLFSEILGFEDACVGPWYHLGIEIQVCSPVAWLQKHVLLWAVKNTAENALCSVQGENMWLLHSIEKNCLSNPEFAQLKHDSMLKEVRVATNKTICHYAPVCPFLFNSVKDKQEGSDKTKDKKRKIIDI